MLEAYLNQREPLTVYLEGEDFIKFHNMNSLTTQELYSLIEASRINNNYSSIIKKVVFSEHKNTLDNFTSYQFQQLAEEWEKHSGVTLQELSTVFATIEQYPSAFQSDLQTSTGFKTITEFLSLSAIDIVTVTKSLLQKDHRSNVYAEISGYAQPLTVANTVEQIVLGLFIMIRGVLYKDPKPISLSFFGIKKTDNQLDELSPVPEDSVMTKEETDDMIQRWRETGKL